MLPSVPRSSQNCSVPGCHREDPLYETCMYVCSQGKAQGQCEDWAVNRGCVLARLPAVSNGLALPVGAALTAAVAPGPPLRDASHRRGWFWVGRSCRKRDRALECRPGALRGGWGVSASAPQMVPTPLLPLTKCRLPRRREQSLGWRAVWAASPEVGLGLSLGGSKEAGSSDPQAGSAPPGVGGV